MQLYFVISVDPGINLKNTYFSAILITVRKGDANSPKIKVFNWGSFSGSTPKNPVLARGRDFTFYLFCITPQAILVPEFPDA